MKGAAPEKDQTVKEAAGRREKGAPGEGQTVKEAAGRG